MSGKWLELLKQIMPNVSARAQQRFAVKYNGGVGGENEVRQSFRRSNKIDLGAAIEQAVVQSCPFSARRRTQCATVSGLALRIHPWIDLI